MPRPSWSVLRATARCAGSRCSSRCSTSPAEDAVWSRRASRSGPRFIRGSRRSRTAAQRVLRVVPRVTAAANTPRESRRPNRHDLQELRASSPRVSSAHRRGGGGREPVECEGWMACHMHGRCSTTELAPRRTAGWHRGTHHTPLEPPSRCSRVGLPLVNASAASDSQRRALKRRATAEQPVATTPAHSPRAAATSASNRRWCIGSAAAARCGCHCTATSHG